MPAILRNDVFLICALAIIIVPALSVVKETFGDVPIMLIGICVFARIVMKSIQFDRELCASRGAP